MEGYEFLDQGNLDLSEARRHLAVADYERTVQGAFREVADALAEQALVQTRRVLLVSSNSLYAALGGGATDKAR